MPRKPQWFYPKLTPKIVPRIERIKNDANTITSPIIAKVKVRFALSIFCLSPPELSQVYPPHPKKKIASSVARMKRRLISVSIAAATSVTPPNGNPDGRIKRKLTVGYGDPGGRVGIGVLVAGGGGFVGSAQDVVDPPHAIQQESPGVLA